METGRRKLLATRPNNGNHDYRVLITARTGKDAALIKASLQKAGFTVEVCPDVAAACSEIERGVGAMVISEESLSRKNISELAKQLAALPSWSDVPIILLTIGGRVSRENLRLQELREPLGNVLLLERPVRPETLVSSVTEALRARSRQYELRDHIEQQKQAEVALRQSEKLAIAGRLAASIAHEINNPLESVTNLLFLAKASEDQQLIKKYIGMAEQELARVSEICTQTLKFHRQNNRPAPVFIPEILDSVLALYSQRLHSNGIEVIKDFGETKPVIGLSGELRQVFANLIGNALDAMRSGGRLRIRARWSSEFTNGMRPGVRVSIADTGSGIPESVRRNLFEPFVSTKGNLGTGLGLWVSRGIVQKHGGIMKLKSCTGGEQHGTVFSVFLPAGTEAVMSAESALAG